MHVSHALIAERYRIVEPLGSGGMGRVWLARDEVLHREVAIKEIVPPEGLTEAEREEIRQRTLREARTAARLSHPNVVRIYDVVRTEQWPWIVMEYVLSRPLHKVIVDDGPMSPQRVAEIGLAVLGALRAAHDAGVLHRDVKPGNVLLAEDGRVVLSDFGLATFASGDGTVTRPGLILGSPEYISPERARDGAAGPESDLWSLGATLYAAVEGRSPFARSSAMATLMALATEPPHPPRRAGALKPVLNALLRKEPSARPSAAEVERMLRRAAGRPGRARPWPLTLTLPRPRRPSTPATASDQDPPSVLPEPAPPSSSSPAAAPPASVPPASVPPASVPPATVPPPQMPPISATRVQSKPVPVPAAPLGAPLRERAGALVGRIPRRAWLVVVAIGVVLIVVLALLSDQQPSPTNRDSAGAPVSSPSTGELSAPTSPLPSAAPSQVPSAGPSAAPTDPGAGGPAPTAAPAQPPPGFQMYEDPTYHWRIAVPAGWSPQRDPGYASIIYFVEPGGARRRLGVDRSPTPKPDPVADWTDLERRRVAAGDFAAYQRVRIEAVPGYFRSAADWEYTYNGSGGRLHVLNRGFVVNDGLAHAIFWLTPDSEWAASVGVFNTIASSFIPGG